MLAKRYTLTADTLTVQNWDDNAPDAEDKTLRRVTDPAILTTLAGSEWVRESTNDEGTLERWTLTVTDAGFEYTFNDSNLSGGFVMSGSTWTNDPENGVIRMVVESVPDGFPQQWWEGDTLHFAYVPNGEADRINVSMWFREQRVEGEGDARRWSSLPNREFPYGDFWHALTRVDP